MTKDEALKLALEALGKVRVMLDNEYNVSPNGEAHEDVVASITAIREALAQPQQEPVAYRSYLESGSYTYCNTAQFFDNAEPLYTSPPARESSSSETMTRKPLTEGEKSLLWAKMFGPNALLHNKPYNCYLTRDGFDKVTKFIETAHGIKGHA